ncbi:MULTISPECIES: MFS transporter [Actinoplanes]|uniref:MFS transporter n=1 Tax=Actinoplanes TaxID=1865 RepID=UPI0005F29785|nr:MULTISPECIES: MFS transporter [Actinoplanes]GLY06740.1 MFS transporter [Actinoplanes sp. NBRC 101535]
MSTTTPHTPSDLPAAKTRLPWRLMVALFLAAIMWIGPYIGSIAVLVPAKVGLIAPDDKVSLVATIALSGALLSLISNIVFGALSDLTRSRFGRRAPMIVFGAVGSAISLVLLSGATSGTGLIVWWCVYILFLNAIIAPMVAVISDRVGEAVRGTISAVYGVGMVLGVSLSQIAGAQFVSDPDTGLLIFAAVSLLSGLLFVVVAPDSDNRDVPRAPFSAKMLLDNFSFPRHNSRDYYLALSGKFLLQAGMYAITNYQLYILTDYIGMTEAESAATITLMATIQLVTSLIFGFGSGPLSDRFQRRKPFVIASALLVAAGLFVPFIAPFAWGMVLFSVLAGVGNGTYASVDQALNIEVLPSKETAAKDLGILNMANSGGQMLGPVITSLVVAVTGGYRFVFLVAFVILIASAWLIKPIRSVR